MTRAFRLFVVVALVFLLFGAYEIVKTSHAILYILAGGCQ